MKFTTAFAYSATIAYICTVLIFFDTKYENDEGPIMEAVPDIGNDGTGSYAELFDVQRR